MSMSKMLNQLKKIINTDTPPPAEKMRIKYMRMKARSEQLTAAQIKAGNVTGQGCIDNYPGGYPL